MKKLYLNIVSKNIRLLLWVVALFTTVSISAQDAEVVKTFTQRTSPFAPAEYKKDAQGKIYNLRGDFTMLGNSNLTMSPYTITAGNNSNMVYVDIDDDGTTVNSSSAVLNLPDAQCTEIVYAGLYWSGRVHDTTNSGNTITVTKSVSTGATTETQTFDHSNDSSLANRLDNTTVSIVRTGGSGNRHSLQTVTIGNIIVEFTLQNNGTVSVRQSIGPNNWNAAVTLAATVNDALVTETFNPSNTSTSNWNLVGSSSYSNGICTRNYSRTQAVTRTGRRVYELATPYIVTYNGVDYAIEKLARYIDATGSRTQQAQKTRTATSSNNCSNFTNNSWNGIDYTITNPGTVSNYTYSGSNGNFTGSTNNYVTIEGPKTNTSTTSGTWTLDKRVIKFKKQDKSYETFTATNDDIYYPSGAHGNMYAAYKDVTEYVREHGAGNYFAADLATAEGSGGGTGYYGGWGLIVVYANPNMKWRDVTIFDGYAYVPGSTTASESLPISGFESAQDGLINVTFGFMAGEGDVSIPDDYLKVLKVGGDPTADHTSTNDWMSLGSTGNTTGGAFHSSINTGGNTRNPNRVNNASFDLQKFDLPNQQGGENVIIGNSQTSTVFKYGSNQDTFIIYNMVFAVDAYVPAVEGLNQVLTTQTTADINNLQPGDEVTYTLDVFNYGSDYIDNGKIDVDVPYAMKLVSYNMVTNSQTASGANDPYAFSQPEWINPATGTASTTQPAASEGGILRWTLGTIPTQVVVTNFVDRVPMATLTYTLKVTDNCLLLQTSKDDCAVKPTINGTITGVGRNSGEKFSTEFIKGYDSDCNNTPIPGGINMKINPSPAFLTNCSLKNPIQGQTRIFRKFCADNENLIPRSEIVAAYIPGTKFYSNLPSSDTPVVVTGDFPVNPNGTQRMYYAVLPGTNQACFYQLVTQLDVITVEPTVNNVSICEGEALQLNNTASTGYTLYYFDANEPEDEHLATVPNPTQPGTYTYWVANGVAQGIDDEAQYCYGAKKAFTITINALPTAAIVNDVQLCTYADYTSSITSGGNTIVWEYLDGSNWVALGTQLTGVSVVTNQLTIAKAPSALNGTTFRVKSTNSTNCTSYSESINLTVKGCNMPVNPMIYTPLNR